MVDDQDAAADRLVRADLRPRLKMTFKCSDELLWGVPSCRFDLHEATIVAVRYQEISGSRAAQEGIYVSDRQSGGCEHDCDGLHEFAPGAEEQAVPDGLRRVARSTQLVRESMALLFV